MSPKLHSWARRPPRHLPRLVAGRFGVHAGSADDAADAAPDASPNPRPAVPGPGRRWEVWDRVTAVAWWALLALVALVALTLIFGF